MIPSLCAAALALMNQQAPPVPLSCGSVFAVNIVLRACNFLQACIRRKYVPCLTNQSVVQASGTQNSRNGISSDGSTSNDFANPEFDTSTDDMRSILLRAT